MQTKKIRDNGIVGAGGAGFPTDIKLDTKAEIVLMNAAECEPLLYKDKELLRKEQDKVLEGFEIAMEMTDADIGIIGIKEKLQGIIESLEKNISNNTKIVAVDDFYPAGYELNLVYETTGRLIQPGELPISQGCVVLNVETLYNMATSKPVIDKYLTVAGAVENPRTIKVPIGTTYEDIIKEFKIETRNFRVIADGLMMGALVDDLSESITKKTSGILVLPETHEYIKNRERYSNLDNTETMAKAACDQCRYCTDLCPMYLLGHPVRPELAMRNRMFEIQGEEEGVNSGNDFCCECNLCTLYACPEGLDPKGSIMMEKEIIQNKDLQWEGLPRETHPMGDYRKTPTGKLMQRLDVVKYKDRAELTNKKIKPNKVKVGLKQHIGAPAKPIVNIEDSINRGDLLAKADGGISANIHSPIEGKISEINEDNLIITKEI